MAFLAQSPDDTEQQQNGNQNQLPQVPLIPSLAGSSGPSGGTNTASTTQGSSNASSPGAAPSQPWANVSSYLSANAPQSKQVADSITGNFNQTFGNIQNQGAQATQNFTNSVNQNTVGLDQDMFNAAKADPTAFAKDPNNVASFQKAYGASYGGPTNFENTSDFSNLQGAIQTAQKNAGLVNQGTSGIETLLQNTGKNATPGQTALDTLLLQEDPNNFQTISTAAKPFAGLTDYLNGQVSSLDQAADAAKTTTGNTASTLQSAFTGPGGVVPNFQNDLSSRLANASNKTSTAANKAQTDLLAGTVTPDDLAVLGIQPGQLNQLSGTMKELQGDYGQNFGLDNYLATQSPDAVFGTANSIATPDDYAEAAALSQLTGANFGTSLDPAQAANAGKQNNSLLNFNFSGANTDVGNQLKENDLNTLNGFIQPRNQSGGNLTINDLVSTYLGKDTSRLFSTPAQNQQFQNALFRYATQWQPGPTQPNTTTTPPVIGTPTQPPQTPIGFNGGAAGIY